MNPYVAADIEEQLTIVTAGEPEEVEHSPWKVAHRVPLLSKETGTRLASFWIVTYSYNARRVELGDLDHTFGDTSPHTYFEVYNSFSQKTERMRVSGDKLVDEGSLKHLLQRIGVKLET